MLSECKHGDVVGFMLVNRPAFNLCDCAAMHVGATCFSIYNTSSPEQIEYLLTDAGNRVVVTEQAFLDRLLPMLERVPTLEHLIVVDGEAPEGSMSLDDFEALGSDSFDFEAAWRAVQPDDVLCLIYTSGTTGPPKGVQLTHDNMMSEWRAFHPGPSRHAGRALDLLPAERARRRPLGQPLLPDGARPDGLLVPEPARDGRLLDVGEADDLGRRAAHLGEAEGGARGRFRGRAGRAEARRRRAGNGGRPAQGPRQAAGRGASGARRGMAQRRTSSSSPASGRRWAWTRWSCSPSAPPPPRRR